MTYYDLLCGFCGRKIGVYSDEAYRTMPDWVYCDGDCWNRQPHRNRPQYPSLSYVPASEGKK
jgi:hypothetical protein